MPDVPGEEALMSVPAGIDYQALFADQLAPDNRGDYADDVSLSDQDAPWLYWRLKDGRVQLLKGGPNGLERAMRGDIPLSGYGMIKRATRDRGTDQDEFAPLVRRNGQHELTADQTLGLHWHRRPTRNDTWSHKEIWGRIDIFMRRGMTEREALDEVLPQLRGVDIPESIVCPYCPGRREFLKREHLLKHEGVMHREDVRTREMRESITDALHTQGGSGGQADLAKMFVDALAQIAGQNAETQASVMHLLKQMQIEPGAEPKRRGRPPKIADAAALEGESETA